MPEIKVKCPFCRREFIVEAETGEVKQTLMPKIELKPKLPPSPGTTTA